MTESSIHPGRWIAAALAALGLVVAFYQVVVDNMPKGEARKIAEYKPWPEETIRIAEDLPVQDGGRIKPLSSHAGFVMLGLHGARSMKIETADGKKVSLKPVPWMMDLLFRPQLAMRQPTFRIDNSAVLEAIGVKPLGRRDRYSYEDLLPGREKLEELVGTFGRMDAEKRDPLQTQILDLSANLRTYESLLGYFNFARNGLVLKGSAENGGSDKHADLSSMMEATTTPDVRKQIDSARSGGTALDPRMEDLLRQVFDAANWARSGFAVLPSISKDEKTWKNAGNSIMEVITGEARDARTAIADVGRMETLARSIDESDGAFRKELAAFSADVAKRSEARGEGRRVGLESIYNRTNLFLNAMALFLTGSIAAMGMWTFGRTKAGTACFLVTLTCSVAGMLCCASAIVMRCVIMERPPVGNLYDTVVFIATAVVLFSLLIEKIVPRRFCLGLAPILGAGLILLARRFEVGDAKDHMDPLVAVLDSNYWLTTHVITITLGYSAGLLGAFLSAAYVLMRGLDLDRGDAALRGVLTRVAYGMVCFTSFLSLVGTVLGGIWANDSWGRFWGWDPKENGALLIVLWTLAILHARLGGYLREWGLHLASVFTAVVVTFSWWHVNFLGVGLHNYGFTAGKNTIWFFYGTMALILLFGLFSMAREEQARQSRRE